MPDPLYLTPHAKHATDRQMKRKCRGPVPRTLSRSVGSIRHSFLLHPIFRFSLLQQPPAPLHNSFPLSSLVSPVVAQRSQGQCAGVHFSHTALNRQRGYADRLRLPHEFVVIVWHNSHWLAGIAAEDSGTRFVLIQYDWQLHCIILFTLLFLFI